jgi:hypothetical protein
MGKRSDFPKIPKDFYRTIDPKAVEPLLPFLVPGSTYAEPCFGVGDLAWLLNDHLTYVWASDINDSGQERLVVKDALTLTADDLQYSDMIITNPPWSRPILHKMIEHFAELKPTWLLFDADWMHTRQSATLLDRYCQSIVSVGRVRWIPGTTMSGKDNCAWYLFHKDKFGDTNFYGRTVK